MNKQLTTLAPTTMAEATDMAKMMAHSNIVPKDYQGNPGNILVAIQWGMELGLGPLQAMQNIAVINGRPSLWGDAMLALVQGHPEFEYIDEEQDDKRAICRLKRRNQPEVVRTFSMADAQAAGLAGKQGPWKQYPKRMMQMRARAWAMRDLFADALRGIQVAEEVQDMREMGTAERAEPSNKPSAAERIKGAATQEEAPAEPEIADAELVEEQDDSRSEDLALAMRECEDLETLNSIATPEAMDGFSEETTNSLRELYKQRRAELSESA